jgi:hypothetical protein
VSDTINSRHPTPVLAATPIRALLGEHLAASLQRQYRADLCRDSALCRRLDLAGESSDHVRRRIAVTRAALAEMEAR